MRASINAMVLFLIFASGCFGGRSGSDDDSDGGLFSTLDPGNTGGSYASFDASRDRICGNNVKEEGEVCDGRDLAGATCSSLAAGQRGTLSCAPDCMNYDTTMCYPDPYPYPPVCGNNVKEEGEICDGTDLAGATCDTLAAGQIGTLACALDCLNYDTTMCYTPPGTCGNNIKEEGEICDGTDLAGVTCSSLNPGQIGTLSCAAHCLNFNTSLCYYPLDDAGVDDDIRIPVSGGCARNTGAQCESDRDCVQGGCGGELCYNPAYGQIATTCDCTAPTNLSCGCVNGVCTWWSADGT